MVKRKMNPKYFYIIRFTVVHLPVNKFHLFTFTHVSDTIYLG